VEHTKDIINDIKIFNIVKFIKGFTLHDEENLEHEEKEKVTEKIIFKMPEIIEVNSKLTNLLLICYSIAQQIAYICQQLHNCKPPIVLQNLSVDSFLVTDEWRVQLVDFSASTTSEKPIQKAKRRDVYAYGKILQAIFGQNTRMLSPDMFNLIEDLRSKDLRKIPTFNQILSGNVFQKSKDYVLNFKLNDGVASDFASLEKWLKENIYQVGLVDEAH